MVQLMYKAAIQHVREVSSMYLRHMLINSKTQQKDMAVIAGQIYSSLLLLSFENN